MRLPPFIRSFLALTLALVGFAFPLQAGPDFSELNKAVDDLFATMDVLAKKVPTVETAEGTAEVLNMWATANEKFAATGKRFADANAEILKQPTPPAEFLAAYGRLSRLKTDYASVPTGVTALLGRFHDDPAVIEALQHFQKSLAMVQKANSPPETPSPKDAKQ
jgi:hypothetical protein